MRTILGLLILLALLSSGCSATPTPMPSPTPSATHTPEPATSTPTLVIPTTTPTTTPTPTHLPNAIPTDELNTSLFHFYEGNPVLQQSNNCQWDCLYIDPGAMVYQDGTFHVFFNGIYGYPIPVGVGYATSTDGYHWIRQVSEPVLSAKALSGKNLIGSNLFVTSALVEDDGTWVLYFYSLSGSTFNGPGDIGRATAPAPTGPWTIEPDPMLSPGPSGAWDAVQVSAPNVIKMEDGYVMYYDARGEDDPTSMIGMATSSDGIHWQKYNDPSTSDPAFAESDPVLKVSADGWDSTRVIDPNVVQTQDGWEMIYLATSGSGKFTQGEFSFGAASSPDGIQWTKSDLNPVLSNTDHPQWSQAFLASLLYVNGKYFLYFDFYTPSARGTNVYLATYDGSLK